MLWCLNRAVSELGNTIPCTVHQTKQPIPRGSDCNVDTIQRAALAFAWQPIQSGHRTLWSLHKSHGKQGLRCLRHMSFSKWQDRAEQFVSTEKGDLEPEDRVYSIMEGAPKGKQCLHTTYFPSSSEVRSPGLLELSYSSHHALRLPALVPNLIMPFESVFIHPQNVLKAAILFIFLFPLSDHSRLISFVFLRN